MTTTASVSLMRPSMRFIAALLALVALFFAYVAVTALVGRSVIPSSMGAFILPVALAALLPAYLIWQQVEAATRYLNEPTLARLGELTASMRRFWRLSGVIAVLQLTVLIAGFALHSGL